MRFWSAGLIIIPSEEFIFLSMMTSSFFFFLQQKQLFTPKMSKNTNKASNINDRVRGLKSRIDKNTRADTTPAPLFVHFFL